MPVVALLVTNFMQGQSPDKETCKLNSKKESNKKTKKKNLKKWREMKEKEQNEFWKLSIKDSSSVELG